MLLRALLLATVLTVPALAKPVISTEDVPVERGWTRELVVEGLEHPWGLAFLPDGTMLVTERPGRLRVIRDGVLAPEPVSGLPEVAAIGQGGLLDIAVHPRFAETGFVYFTYATGSREANRTRVARARFDGTALSEVTDIFTVNREKTGGQHFGARILFLPDETLLVSIGDGGNPPVRLGERFIREEAQDLSSHLGKIIRIRDDGTIPEDNPFVGQAGADPAVYAYGHRNVQGLARDPNSGRIYANEHGALGGDELNLIQPGANSGWPVVTYSREYTGETITDQRTGGGMSDPLLVWQDAVAPSGLMLYTGSAFPQWQGDLFSGGLIGQDVRYIDLDADGAIVAERGLRFGARVRDVRQGPDGFIYVLTDERAARLFRVKPAPQP